MYLKLIVRISKRPSSFASTNIKPESTYFSYAAVSKPQEHKQRLLFLLLLLLLYELDSQDLWELQYYIFLLSAVRP